MQNIHLYAIRSFYSAEAGRLVTLEDDVLSVVSQVRELTDGKVVVQVDPVTEHFHLVEHCPDGTDRLVFTVPELDGRVVQRLREADSQSRLHQDPYDAAEREQDALHDERDHQMLDRLMEVGEELAWSLGDGAKGYGPGYKQSISVPKDVHA